jgi:DNA-binding NarL/FixJ family response regulator
VPVSDKVYVAIRQQSQPDELGMLRVFIIDDSPIIRERLKKMMNSLGDIEIAGECSGYRESVLEISRTRPNVLFVDIKIVGGSGIDLLLEVEKKKWNMIKIVLSNYCTPAYRNACMMAGADYFFDKSMDYVKLRRIIRKLAAAASSYQVEEKLRTGSRKKRH